MNTSRNRPPAATPGARPAGAAPSPAAVATPCVQVCFIDDASGLCLGCLRTLDEIAGWSGFTPERRAELMAELPSRRSRIAPERLGPEPPGTEPFTSR